MDTTVTHLQTTPGRPGHCTILHATCYIIATCMYMYMYVHVACCSLLMVKSDTSHFCHDSIQPTIDRLSSHSSTSECTFKSTCSTLDTKNCRLCTKLLYGKLVTMSEYIRILLQRILSEMLCRVQK